VVPHLGSATHETRRRMAELSVDNLTAGLAGKPLPHEIRA
jgi:glyoxylate reductase